MSDEAYYRLYKFIKNLNKIVEYPKGTSEIVMKVLSNFAENLLWFVEEFKIIKILWIIPIGQVKVRNMRAKICVFGPQTRNFSEHFEILIKILLKIDFFTNFLLNISASSTKVYTFRR